MSTCHQVFAVPELLETILLELPPKDLLLAQRVQITFRDAVRTFRPLRRKLFLSPAQDTTTAEGDKQEVTVNALILRPKRYGNYGFDVPGLEEVVYSPSRVTASIAIYSISDDTIHDLEKFLDTSMAPWLDMYLQSPAVSTNIPLANYGKSILPGKHWAYAEATIGPATVRQILTMAICIFRVAEGHEELYMRTDDLHNYNGDDAQRAELKVECDKVVNGKQIRLSGKDGSIEFDCYGDSVDD